MDKDIKRIMKVLKELLAVVQHNNNLLGFICNQKPESLDNTSSMIMNTPDEMMEEIFKNDAQHDVVGES